MKARAVDNPVGTAEGSIWPGMMAVSSTNWYLGAKHTRVLTSGSKQVILRNSKFSNLSIYKINTLKSALLCMVNELCEKELIT